MHYLDHGASQGRDPHPYSTRAITFPEPRGCERQDEPARTLFASRASKGDPHPLFDSGYYLAMNQTLTRARILIHYLSRGHLGQPAPILIVATI